MKKILLTGAALTSVLLFQSCDSKVEPKADKKDTPAPAAPAPAPAPAPKTETPAPTPAPAPSPTPAPTAAPAAPAPAPAAPAPVAGASEEAAIAALKTKVGEIDAMMKTPPSADNPMAPLISLRTMLGEMGKLPTEGLPTDLKETVVGMQEIFGRVSKSILPFFDGIPTDAEEMKKWQAGLAADPAAAQAVMTKMAGLGPAMQSFDKEMKEKQEAAKAVFKKYNIDPPGGN